MLGHRRRSPRRRRGTAIYRCKIPAMTSHVFIVTTRLAFSWYFYLNLRHVHVDKKSRSTPVKSHVLGEKSAAVVQPCTRRIVQGSLKKDQHGRITRVRVSPATKKTRSRRPTRSSLALAVGRWLVAVLRPRCTHAAAVFAVSGKQAAGTAPPVRARPTATRTHEPRPPANRPPTTPPTAVQS
jgi:hypothetical protein